MRKLRWIVLGFVVVAGAAELRVAPVGAAGSPCPTVVGRASVSGPTRTGAWRAGIERSTAVFDRLPPRGLALARRLAPSDALWVLVVARPRVADARCWLRVRLPWRPNSAAGWVNASDVSVARVPWRIQVSTERRTLTLFRAGRPVRTVSVVVGKPSTPTPHGLFAIVWAVPGDPNAFLGSWVLELTGHSDVLRQFDGGDGTVGIHGRGGASLLDPLGSARSHGCIRMANGDIDWLVAKVGEGRLAGTPVQIG